MARDEADEILEAVQQLGITVGAGEQFEPLPLDEPSLLLGPDPELGEPDRGYVPRDVLATRTTRRELDLGTHGKLLATIPTAPALAFMKLKAYHNRELQWRAHRDPATMATIPTYDRPQVMAKTEAYFYRKAGKDLYDIAFLLAHHSVEKEMWQIVEKTGLTGDLRPLLQKPQEPPLLRFALDMAAEENDAPTREWLEARKA